MAAALPWPDLESFRLHGDQHHRAARLLLTHRRHRPHGAPAVDRWEERELTPTGLRAFCPTATITWTTSLDAPAHAAAV